MGWKKQYKKYKDKAKKAYSGVREKASPYAKQLGAMYSFGLYNPNSKGGGDDGGGYRAEAARNLVKKDVSKQAGAGKINYKTEVYE